MKPCTDVELLCCTVQLSLNSPLYQMDTSEKLTPDVGPYHSQCSYRFLTPKFKTFSRLFPNNNFFFQTHGYKKKVINSDLTKMQEESVFT